MKWKNVNNGPCCFFKILKVHQVHPSLRQIKADLQDLGRLGWTLLFLYYTFMRVCPIPPKRVCPNIQKYYFFTRPARALLITNQIPGQPLKKLNNQLLINSRAQHFSWSKLFSLTSDSFFWPENEHVKISNKEPQSKDEWYFYCK